MSGIKLENSLHQSHLVCDKVPASLQTTPSKIHKPVNPLKKLYLLKQQ